MASTSESNSIVSFDDEPDDVQTSEDEEEIEGVNGFENLSNTCYLNCIFQVLTRTTSLVDFYRNNKYKLLLTDANKTNLSDKFQKLVAIQHTNAGVTISPKGIVDWMHMNMEEDMYRQQDCHEILIKFLDILQTELCNYKTPFQGVYASTLACSTCERQSTINEVNNTLILDVRQTDEPIYLHDCINSFFTDETISCCRKKYDIIDPPLALMILLKRFVSSDGKIEKVMSTVEYPDKLILRDRSYTLYSVISHHGKTISRGHYTSICRVKDKIYHFDDEDWKEVGSFASPSAYMLFYHKDE